MRFPHFFVDKHHPVTVSIETPKGGSRSRGICLLNQALGLSARRNSMDKATPGVRPRDKLSFPGCGEGEIFLIKNDIHIFRNLHTDRTGNGETKSTEHTADH